MTINKSIRRSVTAAALALATAGIATIGFATSASATSGSTDISSTNYTRHYDAGTNGSGNYVWTVRVKNLGNEATYFNLNNSIQASNVSGNLPITTDQVHSSDSDSSNINDLNTSGCAPTPAGSTCQYPIWPGETIWIVMHTKVTSSDANPTRLTVQQNSTSASNDPNLANNSTSADDWITPSGGIRPAK